MYLAIELNDAKGGFIKVLDITNDTITCFSDAAQRLPKWVISHEGRLYGYYTGNYQHYIFRERELICV